MLRDGCVIAKPHTFFIRRALHQAISVSRSNTKRMRGRIVLKKRSKGRARNAFEMPEAMVIESLIRDDEVVTTL
jgi:hypothetical protein